MMRGGPYRCALVVRSGDAVDDQLLAELTARTGLAFARIGNGGFGGGPVADVHADESGGNLLIDTVDPDTGTRAMLVRAVSSERAIAIRAVIGDRFQAWTEQTLRAQLEENIASQPWILVPMMMAVGGAEPEPETMRVLRQTLQHEDETVRSAAEHAEEIAKWLLEDPAVMRVVENQELVGVLRPAQPVDGEEDWVTVRPGSPGRAVPRPVTWLSFPGEPGDLLPAFLWNQDWELEVVGNTRDDFFEQIRVSEDGRTALHEVAHAELAGRYLAVHGQDAEATTTALREAGAEPLDGPPAGLDRTAP